MILRQSNKAGIIALLVDLCLEFVASDSYFLEGRGRQSKPAGLGWVRKPAIGLSWHVCDLSLDQPITELGALFLKPYPVERIIAMDGCLWIFIDMGVSNPCPDSC